MELGKTHLTGRQRIRLPLHCQKIPLQSSITLPTIMIPTVVVPIGLVMFGDLSRDALYDEIMTVSHLMRKLDWPPPLPVVIERGWCKYSQISPGFCQFWRSHAVDGG